MLLHSRITFYFFYILYLFFLYILIYVLLYLKPIPQIGFSLIVFSFMREEDKRFFLFSSSVLFVFATSLRKVLNKVSVNLGGKLLHTAALTGIDIVVLKLNELLFE